MTKYLLACILGFTQMSCFAQDFESSISPISDALQAEMVYSWKESNPVPITDLRLVTVNFWGFDDQPQQGNLIVHANLAEEVVEIFQEMYENQFPIEKMILVEAYQGSDELSAEDNNCYCFCSRPVAGLVGVYSKHSYGIAIDVNPIQNPASKNGVIVPQNGAAYLDRDNPVKGMIDHDSICYQAFIKRGWVWGGDWQETRGYVDYHHFEKPLLN